MKALAKLGQGIAMVLAFCFIAGLFCLHIGATFLVPAFAMIAFERGNNWTGAGLLLATVLVWAAWNLYSSDHESGMHDY